MEKRNVTTFPSLPSDKETSGFRPKRTSGHFNYKKQRNWKEGFVVFAWGSLSVCVCLWWKREQGSKRSWLLIQRRTCKHVCAQKPHKGEYEAYSCAHFMIWKGNKTDKDLKEFSWQYNLTWFENVQLGDKYSTTNHQLCLKILFYWLLEIKSAVFVMTFNSNSFFAKLGHQLKLIKAHSLWE